MRVLQLNHWLALSSLILPLSAQAVTVDLMVVYDSYSKQYFNNQPSTAIRGWVDQVNAAMQNSQVDVQIRLVGTVEREVAGSDMGSVLGNLRTDSFVAQKRSEFGADYVTLVDSSGNCGVGYVAVDRNYAFNVVGPKCGALTMAHELGHTLGLAHSRRQGDTRGARYSYAMGHGVDNSFATIMTYEWLFNAPKVAKYSNPNISCNGRPCGVPDGYSNSADAARAINNVKNEISGFMPTRSGGGTTGGGDTGVAGVCIYEHINYQGASLCFGQTTQNLPASWNDKLSSVKVGSGYTVKLTEHINGAGASVVLTANTPWIGSTFNDRASFLSVTKN